MKSRGNSSLAAIGKKRTHTIRLISKKSLISKTFKAETSATNLNQLILKKMKDNKTKKLKFCSRHFNCDSYPFCLGCKEWTGTTEELQSHINSWFKDKPYKVEIQAPVLDEFEQELYNIIECYGGKFTNSDKECVEAFIRSHAAVLRRIWRKEEFTPDDVLDKDFNLTFDWTENDDKKLEVCKAVVACRAREMMGTVTHQNFEDAATWLYTLKDRITHLGVNKKFTGLYDKNRKPIFEGDWLKTRTGRICEVNYKSTPCFQGWDLTPVDSLKYPNNFDTEAPPKWDLWESENLEIVEK